MSINYKSKNDIPYFKFLEFSNIIESRSPSFVASETVRIFNPKTLTDFSVALTVNKPMRPKYKINLDFKSAGRFIDADTFFLDQDYKAFFNCVLSSNYFFKKVKFDKITLAEAEYYISSFRILKNKLSRSYEYLYNPPMRNVGGKITPGSIERQAFSEYYGPYIEMVYVLCSGDFTKFDEVIAYDLDRFLFQSEYLIRKRDIENLK
jgi:hypothetical protein